MTKLLDDNLKTIIIKINCTSIDNSIFKMSIIALRIKSIMILSHRKYYLLNYYNKKTAFFCGF